MREDSNKIKKIIAFTILTVLTLLVTRPVFGLAYGEGGYGGCKYSQDCPVNSETGSSGTRSGVATGSGSGSSTTTTNEQPNSQSINRGQPARTGGNLTSDSLEKIKSPVSWWRYVCLIFAFVLAFWWFIAAWRRRKKDDKPADSQ